MKVSPAWFLGLALLGGCCAEQAHGSREALTIELEPDQLDRKLWFVEQDGRVVMKDGAQFQPAYVLRGAGTGAAAPALGAPHFRVARGELLVGPDLAVRFDDGRVWIGFPGGSDMPYVDASGRVLRVDRDQLFSIGAFNASDLPDRSKRTSLKKVLTEEERFRPVD